MMLSSGFFPFIQSKIEKYTWFMYKQQPNYLTGNEH
jgi:hypothetical protein